MSDAELESLRARVEHLERGLTLAHDTIAKLETKAVPEEKDDGLPHKPGDPPNTWRFNGALFTIGGGMYVDPNGPTYEDRVRANTARDEAACAEVWRKRTEGLPAGFWRDPCGQVRDAAGNLASYVLREQQDLREIEAEMAEEQDLRVQGIRTFKKEGKRHG